MMFLFLQGDKEVVQDFPLLFPRRLSCVPAMVFRWLHWIRAVGCPAARAVAEPFYPCGAMAGILAVLPLAMVLSVVKDRTPLGCRAQKPKGQALSGLPV